MSFIAYDSLGHPDLCPEKLFRTEWRVWVILIKRRKLYTKLGNRDEWEDRDE